MKNLIKKTTDAMAADEGAYYFTRQDIENYPTIVAVGDLGSDTIPIMYLGSDGETLTQAYDEYGTALELSATNPAVAIKSAMQVKVVKSATTNAVGVDIAGVY